MNLRRRRLLAAPVALVLPASRAQIASPAPASSPAAPLRLGLAPYLSPAALFTAFGRLREHLQRALARPVELQTARDFIALAAAVRSHGYDVALLPAHMARLAVTDWSCQPMARTSIIADVLLLVRSDGPVRTQADLRGRRIGMLDLHSLSAAVAVQWLHAQRLADVLEIVRLPSINSGLHALALDDVAAVVAAETQLLTLPAGTPNNHRVLARLSDIPGPWLVARPAPPAQLARWRAALYSYAPDGHRPTTAANSRLAPLTVADTAPQAAHAAFLRRQLALPR